MSLLEIPCSSRSSCSSSLKVCGGSSSVLWRLESVKLHWFMVIKVSRGFWAWFQQTLGSRQIVWMILLGMFFDFEVEFLEGFEAWFLQSFCTSKYFWIFFDATCALDVLVFRNALGRLLFIGVWGWVSHTRRSSIGDMCHTLIRGALRLLLQDTWHLLIGKNVLIFKVTHVSTRLDFLCHRLHALGCLCHRLHMPICDWFCIHFMPLFQQHLANFCWFLNSDSKT